MGIFIPYNLISQTNESKLGGLNEEIENLIERYETVGVSIAIVENNEIIYSKGFGYRDFDRKLEMTANTAMPIGSITKSFTSSLIGILNQNELVSLFEKPSYYIPKLKFYNDKMDLLISVEDLLSHKSGLGNMDASAAFFPVINTNDFVSRFTYLKPTGEIKNSFAYSNVGYGLLGSIIENETNISWQENIKQHILRSRNG